MVEQRSEKLRRRRAWLCSGSCRTQDMVYVFDSFYLVTKQDAVAVKQVLKPAGISVAFSVRGEHVGAMILHRETLEADVGAVGLVASARQAGASVAVVHTESSSPHDLRHFVLEFVFAGIESGLELGIVAMADIRPDQEAEIGHRPHRVLVFEAAV